MSKIEFKVGDRVKCSFYGDKIFTLTGHDPDGYLFIEYEGHSLSFYRDGRHSRQHTHSPLTLIDGAKPKVKVEVCIWSNIYADNDNTYYTSKGLADQSCWHDRIACVELKGEYEI